MPADRTSRFGLRLRYLAAFLCGFAVLFNTYLLPGSSLGSSPRLSDVLGVVAAGCMGVLFLRGRLDGRVVGVLAALALPPLVYAIVTLGGGLMDEEPLSKTSFAGVRWILALSFGYLANLMVQDGRTRQAILIGVIVAAIGNTVVIALQSAGLGDMLVELGLAAPERAFSWIDMVLRPSGMQGHANGSTAVVSLIVPAVFYLYWSGRAGIWVCAAGLGVLVVATEYTLTRGPLIVTAISLGLSGLVYRRVRATTPIFVAAALAVVLAIGLFGPPGGWERWSSEQNTSENFSERLNSNIATVELIARNPFGIGTVAPVELIREAAGVPSSHNALLNAAICFGLPFGLLLTLLLLSNLARAPVGEVDSLYFLLSLHSLLLFCFEDLLLTPTFIAFGGWLAAGGAARLFPPRPQAAGPAYRLGMAERAR